MKGVDAWKLIQHAEGSRFDTVMVQNENNILVQGGTGNFVLV